MLPRLSTRKKPNILAVRVDEVSLYAEEESTASDFNQMECIKKTHRRGISSLACEKLSGEVSTKAGMDW